MENENKDTLLKKLAGVAFNVMYETIVEHRRAYRLDPVWYPSEKWCRERYQYLFECFENVFLKTIDNSDSIDKQTEEMAKHLCGIPKACKDCRLNGLCLCRNSADILYNAGYRKSSDVVKTIITEVKELITEVYDSHIYNSDLEDTEKEAIMDFTNDLDFTKIENKYIFPQAANSDSRQTIEQKNKKERERTPNEEKTDKPD